MDKRVPSLRWQPPLYELPFEKLNSKRKEGVLNKMEENKC